MSRFLNRVLGLPIHRQNFAFNYFLAVLSADIRTAKAEGRYSEGMSDLPASQISFACPPEVSLLFSMAACTRPSLQVSMPAVGRAVQADACPMVCPT